MEKSKSRDWWSHNVSEGVVRMLAQKETSGGSSKGCLWYSVTSSHLVEDYFLVHTECLFTSVECTAATSLHLS